MNASVYPRDLRELREMRLAAEVTNNIEAVGVLSALEESWRILHPGRDRHFVTVLTLSGLRAVVRSLLPRGVEQASEREWKHMGMCAKIGTEGCGPGMVSPEIVVLDLENALLATCPLCSKLHLAFEHRYQANDRGLYVKKRTVLCATDNAFAVKPLHGYEGERYGSYKEMLAADLRTHDEACGETRFEERLSRR